MAQHVDLVGTFRPASRLTEATSSRSAPSGTQALPARLSGLIQRATPSSFSSAIGCIPTVKATLGHCAVVLLRLLPAPLPIRFPRKRVPKHRAPQLSCWRVSLG